MVALAACGGPYSGAPASTALATTIVTGTPSPSLTPIQVTIHSNDNGTPPYVPDQLLLAKIAGVGPVYVTGGRAVPDAALIAAGDMLGSMLRHRPDIGAQLRMYGVFTVVASHNETICDLPYFSAYRQTTVCARFGEGGAGGFDGHPITACAERNLLKEPDDPYGRGTTQIGQNICVHELAHTIMTFGLQSNDRVRIYERYLAAKAEGLWAGDYAMTNKEEFWAVMSQFYFDAGPDAPYSAAFHHIANGPTALKAYDPATFALVDSIYQGSTNLQ